jgi:toxin ParE1/3/4
MDEITKRIILRPKVSQDLDDHFSYLAETNSEAAFQFFDSARLTIAQIARMPGMGILYHFIFYLERDDAIEVVRILHGMRDISSILEGER